MFREGVALRKEGKNDDALSTLGEALKIFEGKYLKASGKTLYQIGLVYDRSNRDKTAVDYYLKAIEVGDQMIKEQDDYSVSRSTLLQIGYAYLYIDEMRKSTNSLLKLLEYAQLDTINQTQYLTYSHNLLASNYQYLGKWDSASYHATEALKVSESLGDDDIQIRGESFNCNAELNYNLGNYKEAQFYLNKQLEMYREVLGQFHPATARPIMQLGITAQGASNYADAANYFQQGLDLSVLNGDSTSYNYVNLTLNASSLYEMLDQNDKAIEYMGKTIAVYEKIESGSIDTWESYAVMAHLQSKVNAFEKATEYIEKAKPIFDQGSDKSYRQQKAARKIAKAYTKMKQHEEARTYAMLSLDLLKTTKSDGNELAYAYLTVGQALLDLEDINQARIYIDSANMANTKDGGFENLNVVVESSRLLMDLLSASLDSYATEEIIEQVNYYDSLISGFRVNIDSELGETFESQHFYDAAVRLAFDSYDKFEDEKLLNLFIRLSDRNRSGALKDLIGKAEFYETIELGEGVLETKKQLIRDLAILKRRIGSSKDPSLTASLNIEFENKKEEFDRFKNLLAKDYPIYHEYNYSVSSLDIDLLKSKLGNSKETLISYYLLEDALCIAVGSETFNLVKVVWEPVIPYLITGFRSKITNPNSEIIHGADMLHHLLIEPIEDYITTDQIRIINDGVLSYLPFELLKNDQNKYLFEQYDITYSYSMGTYLLNNKVNRGKQLLAYAPLFEGETLSDPIRAEIGYLPGTKQELDAINSQLNGEFISGINASETDFKNRSEDYDILHLATHAIVDDRSPDYSRLLFNSEKDSLNDGDLHAYEIFGMNLQAKLVTLSACNTGFGKIKRGEGVMSLSRAFAYAGVPATVVSLWPASDKSTPQLMKYFYQYLQDGQSKDVALNNARKQYLETAQGKARHPFYWGGFVVIGDNTPITGHTNLLVWMFPVLIIIILIGTVLKKRKQADKD